MAEPGCLHDANFQNLEVNGGLTLDGTYTQFMVNSPSVSQGKTSVLIGKAGGANPFSEGTTQLFPLGTKLIYGDNVYRYAKSGAAIKAGLLVQAAAITEGDIAVQTAVTAADTSIAVTTTETTSANQYDEGYVVITQNNAQSDRVGGAFRIKSHTTGSAGPQTFTLYDPINIALDTSSKVTVIANKYNGVITAASTLTAEMVGVTNPIQDVDDTVTSGSYFWLQTHGLCAIVATDISYLSVIGQPVYHFLDSSGIAGNVAAFNTEAISGTTATTTALINKSFQVGWLVDAPSGANADAAIVRLLGFN